MRLTYTLEVIAGAMRGTLFPLTRKETVIGRGGDCDIRLEDTEASRRHCQITVSQGTVLLKDLGSSNGVQVNGRLADNMVLSNGDMIRIGKTELRLVAQEENSTGDQTQAFTVSNESSFVRRLRNLGWSNRILAVMLVAALISHALVAWPLISAQRKMTSDEALRKAGALVTALSALNQEALRLNDEMLLEVDSIAQHEGVVEVFIYDRLGRILAPVSRFHQIPSDEASKNVLTTESRMMSERAKGVYDLAEPIRVYNVQTGRFDRIGTARIIFSLHTIASLEAGTQRNALISLIVLLLVAAVVAKAVASVTSAPITLLRDDLEAVLKGDRTALRETYRMKQLDVLATSIGRCLAKASAFGNIAHAPSQAVSDKKENTESTMAMDDFSESLLDAVLVVDGHNNVIQLNAAFATMMGGVKEHLLGRHFFEAFSDQQLLSGIIKLVQTAMASDGHSATAEIKAEQGLFLVKATLRGVSGNEEFHRLIMIFRQQEPGGD